MRRCLCPVLLTVAVALAGVGMSTIVASPAEATAAKSNRVILSGANWLSGHGVDVYSNDGDYNSKASDLEYVHGVLSGYRWQCVELVNRLYLTQGWTSTNWVGNGADMYGTAPSNLSKEANGSISDVRAGDVISFGGGWGNYGHVAIVDHVSQASTNLMTVYTVNQNLHDYDDATAAQFTWNQATHTISHWDGYTTNGLVHAPANLTTSPTASLPSGASPIKNGGFNGSYAYWSASGSANIAQYTSSSATTPYEGAGFVATNAAQSGDSIGQLVSVNISTADTYCASAYVVTVGAGSGGSGALALWLLGGNSNEYSSYSFSNLPGSNGWTQAKTCVTATTSHTQLKVQFYPNPGAPTIGIDAVDVHQTLSANGGFNSGMAYWGAMPGTNYTSYTEAQRTLPYEGSRFAATNTSAGGGSIFQDLPRSIWAGDTFCVDAQLVTVGDATGAAGSLVIWLIGESPTETSAYSFSNLPGGSAWSPAKACATATGAHTMIRVQLYPAVNMPTVGIDAVDVHASIAQNSGFNADSGHWSAVGSLSYMTYQNVDGTLPYEGGGFEIIHVDASGGSFSQTRNWNIAAGETFCAEASVVAGGYAVNGSGILALWIMGGLELYGSSINFGGLQGGNNWQRVKTCTMANAAVSNAVIKVEFYPTPGGPAIGIDAVDVH